MILDCAHTDCAEGATFRCSECGRTFCGLHDGSFIDDEGTKISPSECPECWESARQAREVAHRIRQAEEFAALDARRTQEARLREVVAELVRLGYPGAHEEVNHVSVRKFGRTRRWTEPRWKVWDVGLREWSWEVPDGVYIDSRYGSGSSKTVHGKRPTIVHDNGQLWWADGVNKPQDYTVNTHFRAWEELPEIIAILEGHLPKP